MEDVNILNESVKKNSGKKVLLISIACLIIALVGVWYFVFNKASGNPKSTYLKVIDTFASRAKSTVDESYGLLNKPVGLDYNIDFKLNSNNSDINKLANILNKIKLNMNSEADYKGKKANLDIDMIYNNKSLLRAGLYLNNKEVYLESQAIYSKAFRVSEEELAEIWNIYSNEDYKVIINEISNILKNNLKDEYFSSVADSDIIKHVLTLNSDNLYDLEMNILNDASNNEKLIDAIANTTLQDKADIKEAIQDAKKELVKNAENYLVIEVSINKSNHKLVKVNIDAAGDKVVFNQNGNKYDIIVFEGEESKTIGTIELSDKLIDLAINYEGAKFEYYINVDKKNTTVKAAFEAEGVAVKITTIGDDKEGKSTIAIKTDDNYIDLTVNIEYKLNELNNIQNKNVTNYVDIENITENDYNEIMQNIYNNENLIQFVQDIMNLGIEI